ncbi:MAG: heavy-metal-associated domain-containing protein [Actinomycetota bacterium]|nr:heavy-metal-associated domain-containing protein [Actinomycetota bacterium]
MCGIEAKDELTLTSAEASSCACCSTDATTAAPADAAGDPYRLEGLTCGHCVQSVEKAVSAVPGVESASVNLVAGGTSALTVSGNADQAAILAAVSGAGYVATGG